MGPDRRFKLPAANLPHIASSAALQHLHRRLSHVAALPAPSHSRLSRLSRRLPCKQVEHRNSVSHRGESFSRCLSSRVSRPSHRRPTRLRKASSWSIFSHRNHTCAARSTCCDLSHTPSREAFLRRMIPGSTLPIGCASFYSLPDINISWTTATARLGCQPPLEISISP